MTKKNSYFSSLKEKTAKPFAFALGILAISSPAHSDDMTHELDLSGTWAFQIDEADSGLEEKWFSKALPETVELPGSMPEQKKGRRVDSETEFTGSIWKNYEGGETWKDDENYKPFLKKDEFRFPFWLVSEYHYTGPAWYQRTFEVPENWSQSEIQLLLERPHWETQVWLNEKPLGMQNALGVPHRYQLTSALKSGKNTLTIRIDNRLKDIDVGRDAHSISDNTQSNWNGIVGDIKLVRFPSVSVSNVAIFPDLEKKSVELRVSISNTTGQTQVGTLNLSAVALGQEGHQIEAQKVDFQADTETTTVICHYPLGDEMWTWDEFNPNLYDLKVSLKSEQHQNIWDGQFGMREIRKNNQSLEINGRPLYLRGTLECAIFPKTGYPPTEKEPWERIITIAKAHGLNHIRFHSWCPPKAAFEVADRMGFYYQVEASSWASDLGSGKAIDDWIYQESDRMIEEYGNHPSFCLMPYGNEPHGPKHVEYLIDFVKHYKAKDSRRIYTTGAGWPVIPENDFHNIYHHVRIQGWNSNLNSIINSQPPRTNYDWSGALKTFTSPVVSHEIGQWCVYPNFKEIPKYDGVLKATNFEIFKDSLASKGLLPLADQYVQASGKLQALCYKADIEAALRTVGFGGFQLLDLRDFPGQGSALVGVLDPFWDEKGYISAEEFSQFCNETVPLARFAKRSFTSDENIECSVEVAHYGETEFESIAPQWQIVDTLGKVVREGSLPTTKITWGNGQNLGNISESLPVTKAQQFELRVMVGDYVNTWDFWVYPAQLPESADDILVVRELGKEAQAVLEKGGKVLLTVEKGSIGEDQGGSVGVGFSSIFWNTAWTNGQLPHTLGILCDPAHSALADFPTEFHSNWQWWDAMSNSNAISLESLDNTPEPIVRIIDDWVTNRNLAMLFEVRVGQGSLFVSGVDLVSNLEKRPEARQMLFSIRNYMSSDSFVPATETSLGSLRSLFKTPAEMLKRSAKATATSFEKGFEAQNLLDGNPETLWHTAWKNQIDPYSHTVTIDLGKSVTLAGLTCLPRQDGNLNGTITDFEVYLSDNSQEKGQLVKAGSFPQGAGPHTILFEQPQRRQILTLVAKKGLGNSQSASLAEIDFILAAE